MSDEEPRRWVAGLVRDYLARHFEISAAVAFLVEARARFWVTGGAVRSALLSPASYNDLDLVVFGSEIPELFSRLGLEKTQTRYGGARFYWNRLAVDLMFAGDSGDPEAVSAVLRTFDIDVNAIAFEPSSGTVIDPLGAVARLRARRICLNRAAWAEIGDVTIANQAIRLSKLLHEVPDLRIGPEDMRFLREVVVTRLAGVDWASLTSRFPLGRSRFVERFEALLEKQSE